MSTEDDERYSRVILTPRSFIVYFACPSCGVCYSAVQAPSSNAKPKRFSCRECKSVVYEWSVGYDYYAWRRHKVRPAARLTWRP